MGNDFYCPLRDLIKTIKTIGGLQDSKFLDSLGLSVTDRCIGNRCGMSFYVTSGFLL